VCHNDVWHNNMSHIILQLAGTDVHIHVHTHAHTHTHTHTHTHGVYACAKWTWISRRHMTAAICCNMLQHTATHTSRENCVLSHESCNRVQHAATECNMLQQSATRCNIAQHTHQQRIVHCHVTAATCCKTLQHTETRCNTLQQTL